MPKRWAVLHCIAMERYNLYTCPDLGLMLKLPILSTKATHQQADKFSLRNVFAYLRVRRYVQQVTCGTHLVFLHFEVHLAGTEFRLRRRVLVGAAQVLHHDLRVPRSLLHQRLHHHHILKETTRRIRCRYSVSIQCCPHNSKWIFGVISFELCRIEEETHRKATFPNAQCFPHRSKLCDANTNITFLGLKT